MTDHIDRAAEVLIEHTRTRIEGCHCGWSKLGASHAEHVAQAFDAAGLLVAPERDAAVAARALREAADKVDRDRRIHDASCGESPAQTHEQAGRDHGVTIGLRQAVRHLNERADRIEQGD